MPYDRTETILRQELKRLIDEMTHLRQRIPQVADYIFNYSLDAYVLPFLLRLNRELFSSREKYSAFIALCRISLHYQHLLYLVKTPAYRDFELIVICEENQAALQEIYRLFTLCLQLSDRFHLALRRWHVPGIQLYNRDGRARDDKEGRNLLFESRIERLRILTAEAESIFARLRAGTPLTDFFADDTTIKPRMPLLEPGRIPPQRKRKPALRIATDMREDEAAAAAAKAAGCRP